MGQHGVVVQLYYILSVDRDPLTIGILLFSGSLYVVSLADIRWLGAVTPIGGLAFLAGWIFLGWRIWGDACPHATGDTI